MNEATLRRRHAASHRSFYRVLGAAAPDSSLVELRGGVQATVVPSRPERSILNAALYTDAEALIGSLPELADRYAAAGVDAWGVWTPPDDNAVTEALAAHGLQRDSWPMVMAAAMQDLDLEPRREIELHPAANYAMVAEADDLAYGFSAGESLRPALAALDDATTRAHVATVDGHPAAAAVSHRHDGDCYLYFVGTIPAARGQGLAGELVRGLLREARDTGATSVSLESTAMAQSLYAAIGYRELGPIELWERRGA